MITQVTGKEQTPFFSEKEKGIAGPVDSSLEKIVQQVLPKAEEYQTVLFVKKQVKACVDFDGDKKMFRLFAEACFFRQVEPDTLKTILLDAMSGEYANSGARKNFEKKISRYHKKWVEKLKTKQPTDPLRIFEKYAELSESRTLDKKSQKILETLNGIKQRNIGAEEVQGDTVKAFVKAARLLESSFIAVKTLKKDDGRVYDTPKGTKVGFEYDDFRRAKKGVKEKGDSKSKANPGYVKLLGDKEIWSVVKKDLEAFKALLKKSGITDEKVLDKIDTVKKKAEKKAEKSA